MVSTIIVLGLSFIVVIGWPVHFERVIHVYANTIYLRASQ